MHAGNSSFHQIIDRFAAHITQPDDLLRGSVDAHDADEDCMEWNYP